MFLTGQPAQALALVDQQLALNPQDPEEVGWAMLQRCRASLALGRLETRSWPAKRTSRWTIGGCLTFTSSQATHSRELPPTLPPKRQRSCNCGGISIASFKALRYSDDPTYLQQAETYLYAGLRKAGIQRSRKAHAELAGHAS
jgi:hypothetical protein